WGWEDRLREMLGATAVNVQSVRRALPVAMPPAFETQHDALREGEA
ncbi:MAG: hypothetical protein H7Z38_08560, partial [Rubrivivax sp.]|nr:hypothetical protein [Pyrinomonadaceae bacterium]